MSETDDVWGRPELPPRPRDPGEVVARFNAYLPSTPFGYSRDNHLLVKLAVEPLEEWKARLVADWAGRDLYIEVRAKIVSDDDVIAKLIAAANKEGDTP